DFAAFGFAEIVSEAIDEEMVARDDFDRKNVFALFDHNRHAVRVFADVGAIAVTGFRGTAEETVAWKPNAVGLASELEILFFDERNDGARSVEAFEAAVFWSDEVVILDAPDPVIFNATQKVRDFFGGILIDKIFVGDAVQGRLHGA